MLRFVHTVIVSLPSSKSLTLYWNLGSFLGLILLVQVMSGLMMVLYYSNSSNFAFFSVDFIMRETNSGWFFRIVHSNLASLYMLVMYFHIFKALYHGSYQLRYAWFTGVFLLLGSMMVAFFGYVLVWSQMSYWAGVVITSLLTVLPFGDVFLYWIWGGHSLGTAFLRFSYLLHFLVPWLVVLLVVTHLWGLHKTGSSSPLYYVGGMSKGWFSPYYVVKDLFNVVIFLGFLSASMFSPFWLSDPEMFLEANSMVSPVHIVPEWYFCAHYGILRSIPNKSVGVLALAMSVGVLVILGFLGSPFSLMSMFNKIIINLLLLNVIFLGWLGQCPAAFPYTQYSLGHTVIYFFSIFFVFFVMFFSKHLYL